MMLFESYYYKIIDTTKNVAAKVKYIFTHHDNRIQHMKNGIRVETKVNNKRYKIEFIAVPAYGVGTVAYLTDRNTKKPVPVTLRSGEKRDRIMPEMKQVKIGINLANLIMDRVPENLILYKNAEQFIAENGSDAYKFDQVDHKIFTEICYDFIFTVFFQEILAHELQHYYGPREHNWIPKTIKREITPEIQQLNAYQDADRKKGEKRKSLNKKALQKYINYLHSNDEVDSAVAEAAMFVITKAARNEDLFSTSSADDFVERCINHLYDRHKWSLYSPDIKDKVKNKFKALHRYIRINTPRT